MVSGFLSQRASSQGVELVTAARRDDLNPAVRARIGARFQPRRRRPLFAWVAGLCLVASLEPSLAMAQKVDDATRGAARELAQQGVAAFQGGDYQAAVTALERAYAVLKVPSIGLWSARAYERAGKLVEASERYLEVTRLRATSGDAEIQERARIEAAAAVEALTPRIPKVTFEVSGDGAQEAALTIDGTSVPPALFGVPRPVNPGAHRVVAKLGGRTKEMILTLREGEAQKAVIDLGPATADSPGSAPPVAVGQAPPKADAPSAPRPGSGHRTAGFVTLGVGGAALVAGGITAILVGSSKSNLEPSCRDDVCDPAKQSEIERYNTLRQVSGVGLIAGAVLAGTGLTLLLTAPSARQKARVTEIYLAGSAVAVRGRF